MRKNRLNLLWTLLMVALTSSAQELIEMTATQAKTYYKNVNKRWVTCHDPSVVWDSVANRYYIFGSHLAQAYTSDLQNWTTFRAPWGAIQADGSIKSNASNAEAFVTHGVKNVVINGVSVPFGNFNAHDWAAAYGGDYNINGNMWAPDVIYNKAMKKWCMYMSVNGPSWNSVIVLLTSDKIDGTYVYQGPVVYTGFKSGSDANTSWKKTDLEVVLGEQTTLPSRYAQGDKWGEYWPNGIDPCVFYDETGRLWMSYGSWSGGIWMLELDENTGLRDYNVTYTSDYATKGKNGISDPYFGKKIAGGHYVSGEASYIEYIGGYYFLFMTYGELKSVGGYQMRVFRSKNPDGPYVDGQSRNAVFTGKYVLNYGLNADTRGQLIMGAYDKWGLMSLGELAQGHNSVIAAPDGRSYLVYHTRFNDGTEGHQVRVHQLYLNKNGWLVASPFEYNGGTTTDTDIATKPIVETNDIPGAYSLLVHRYALDHANREVVTPVEIKLNADGTVSGAYQGTWSREEGTGYFTIKLGSVTYQGVITEEQMDVKNIRAYTFTACAANGVHVWGYKMRPDYALAYQLNNQTIPVTNGKNISQNIDLNSVQVTKFVDMEWSSSHPDIISESGRYNPTGLTEDVSVDLNLRLSAGNYYWTQDYRVYAKAESMPVADWMSGIVAYYDFDSTAILNSVNPSQRAFLTKAGTNSKPTQETDGVRNGQYVHLSFGGNGNESYVSMPNPLLNAEIEDGFTISFWTKRTDNNVWDALFAFYNTTSKERFYMTGSTYIGYNNNTGNWIDINHPTTYSKVNIATGGWHLVTITVSRQATAGIKVYIDGVRVSTYDYNGSLNGTTISSGAAFDYNLIIDHIVKCSRLTFGYGSFWGSPDASFDDVVVHNRILSLLEIQALKQVMNRVFDMGQATGIRNAEMDMIPVRQSSGVIYDLSGRRVENPTPGIYIRDGKKFIVR